MASQDLTTLPLFEEWRDVQGYEGQYRISSFGRVESLDRYDAANRNWKGRILRINYLPAGYEIVNLSKNGETNMARVHRLVAEAFIPNPLNLPEVNHKDGNKANNQYTNLEWMTKQQNIAHAILYGLDNKGSRHGFAKLTEPDVVKILDLLRHDKTHKEIAEIFGVSKGCIATIYRNEGWTHVSRGTTDDLVATREWQAAALPKKLSLARLWHFLAINDVSRGLVNHYLPAWLLAQYETGKKVPSEEMLTALASFYQIPYKLFENGGNPPLIP